MEGSFTVTSETDCKQSPVIFLTVLKEQWFVWIVPCMAEVVLIKEDDNWRSSHILFTCKWIEEQPSIY